MNIMRLEDTSLPHVFNVLKLVTIIW